MIKHAPIKPVETRRKVSLGEWRNEGRKLFGEDIKGWQFQCPVCKGIQTANLFRKHNIDPNGKVYFSCIGRWVNNIGCDWTLGGLFLIHTLEVQNEAGEYCPVFEFAKQVTAKAESK